MDSSPQAKDQSGGSGGGRPFEGRPRPVPLRKSTRVAAGVLGFLSLLVIPVALVFVLSSREADAWKMLISAVVVAPIFLYVAWSGVSPAWLEQPEYFLNPNNWTKRRR
jgi:hypothetical protein